MRRRNRLIFAALALAVLGILLAAILAPLVESYYERHLREDALRSFFARILDGSTNQALAHVVSRDMSPAAESIDRTLNDATRSAQRKCIQTIHDELAGRVPSGIAIRDVEVVYQPEPDGVSGDSPWWSPFEFSPTCYLDGETYKMDVVREVVLLLEDEESISVRFFPDLLMFKIDGEWYVEFLCPFTVLVRQSVRELPAQRPGQTRKGAEALTDGSSEAPEPVEWCTPTSEEGNKDED